MKTSENIKVILFSDLDKSKRLDRNPLPITKSLYELVYPYLDGKSFANLSTSSRFFDRHITDKDWKLRVETDISSRPNLAIIDNENISGNSFESYKSLYKRAALIRSQLESASKTLKKMGALQSEVKERKALEQLIKEMQALMLTVNQLVTEAIALNWDCHKFSKLVPGFVFSPKNVQNFRFGFLNSTMLHLAVTAGSYEFVTFLLDRGADVNALQKGFFYVPMSRATNSGFGLLTSPLDHGVVDWLENWGRSPLMLAAMHKHSHCLSILLERQANVNTTCLSAGNTALHEAASSGSLECVQMLIKAGAILTKKNKEHNLPIACARENGHLDCEKAIEEEMRKRHLEIPSSSSCACVIL